MKNEKFKFPLRSLRAVSRPNARLNGTGRASWPGGLCVLCGKVFSMLSMTPSPVLTDTQCSRLDCFSKEFTIISLALHNSCNERETALAIAVVKILTPQSPLYKIERGNVRKLTRG